MRVIVTPEAVEALHKKKPDSDATLRVAAIAVDLGAVTTELFELFWDHLQPSDRRFAISDSLTVVMDPYSLNVFAPELMISFDQAKGSFSVKNREQIFLHQIYI
ncbi:iron-sulfur cluster biosynthesis family protein [Hazenella coriacea]|uniref:Core domain-containing protein n=1 Tax=Hazenella coriacea TaxID=1179467 RepID=A0A4R3L4G7_9BACL|nr:iron-sulfur cluster biosynthesis family protein [Hazenella coriacea]TCS94661.1 hypothetical protein EDD58_10373 [Hazenella coriacea]